MKTEPCLEGPGVHVLLSMAFRAGSVAEFYRLQRNSARIKNINYHPRPKESPVSRLILVLVLSIAVSIYAWQMLSKN